MMALVLEDAAVAVLVEVQHVRAAYKVAVTSIDWVVALVHGVLGTSCALPDETRSLAKHLFLDIEFVAAEVS